MVDGINIISLKIKSFDENVSDDDKFPDSEPYEEEIFNDVRRNDRICAQCGQNHSSKPNFSGTKTIIESIPQLFSLNKNYTEISTDNRNYDTNYTQVLTCRHCKAVVVAEVTTTIYNLDSYVEDQKVKHGHSADPKTVGRVLERIAAERRLLEEWDPNDYDYYVRSGWASG